MIARIKGVVEDKLPDRAIIDVGGLGYEVFLSAGDLQSIHNGDVVNFVVYEQLREDAHNLYGFALNEAREFFILLISTSGVGPKVAMAIMSSTTLSQLKSAISSGDAELFRGVAGVGKKTAERIMIELKGKLSVGESPGLVSSDSAYQALIGLGYSSPQAAEAIAKLPSNLPDDQSRIKAALKELAK